MRYAVLLVLLVGCGGDPSAMEMMPPGPLGQGGFQQPPPQPATCDGSPSGLYRQVLVKEGGDCPPLPETVVDLSTGGDSGACTVIRNNRAGCIVETVVICPSKRTDLEDLNCRMYGCTGMPTVSTSMHAEWQPGWAAAVGTVGFDVTGHSPPAANCHGVYSLSLTKL